MLQTIKALIAVACGLIGITSPAAADHMKAFPPPDKG